jgi:hypothetical protein
MSSNPDPTPAPSSASSSTRQSTPRYAPPASAVASPLGALTREPQAQAQGRTQPAPRPAPEPVRVPLARRPRRERVQREPSQRAAARSLRSTAEVTTGRTWRRGALPQPERASAGVPVSESVASCSALALLFVPLGLWVGAVPAVVAGAIAVTVLACLLCIRRVVVGQSYVAVRQLGRFHVATVDHVRHLELKPSERGGVLCVHTDDGRCMRLRRAEVADPAVGAALRELWRDGDGTHDPLVAAMLDLPDEQSRIRHRYLADAIG